MANLHFTFEIDRVHWQCGDGCCSDGWYEYEVYDNNGKYYLNNDEIRLHSKEAVIQYIKDEMILNYDIEIYDSNHTIKYDVRED